MDSQVDNANKTRILIVDDHAHLREAIAILINMENDFSVCGEADSIPLALDLYDSLRPDLVLIDISLKGENGLDLLKQLVQYTPPACCVVFSLHDEAHYIETARTAGARGYAIKSGGAQGLLPCLRQVRNGINNFASPGQS